MSLVLAAVTRALAASAGVAPPPAIDDIQRVTLLQVSLDQPAATIAPALRRAMAEETARLRSCAEALGLDTRLKARGLHGVMRYDLKVNAPLSAVPPVLRAALLARPIGHATPLYGGEKAMRVLIRCEAGFKFPVRPKPVRPEGRAPLIAI